MREPEDMATLSHPGPNAPALHGQHQARFLGGLGFLNPGSPRSPEAMGAYWKMPPLQV